MSTIKNIFRSISLLLPIAVIFAACNKDLPEAEPIEYEDATGPSIYSQISGNASYSYLLAAITRAAGFAHPAGKIDALLKDSSKTFTFFAPDNAAFQMSFAALGLPTEVTTLFGFRPGQLDTILRYHLIGGQQLTSANVTSDFPNMYLQSNFVLAAPSASLPPGLRMPLFLTKRGSNLTINNLPVTGPDMTVGNTSVIHKVPFILLPPSRYLWHRIDTDTSLAYLEAAINRADSGVAAASTLRAALSNPAANLTIFAPDNAAFKMLLTGQITLALMGMGLPQDMALAQASALASTPNVFANPALWNVLTPTVVKGIVVYHILGKRAFLINFPGTATAVPTLLNTAIAAHPGVTIQATFGLTGVTAATVKGAANATASNVMINPMSDPAGSSDQHFVNGVIHKIDQVLLPQ